MYSDYGSHPTSLGALKNDQLFSVYREAVWSNLSENQRLEVLQETCNRSAMARGEIGSCEVVLSDQMEPGTMGQQSGNRIELNRDLVMGNRRTVTYHNHTMEEPNWDSNLQSLLTVLHEDVHAWQNQCIHGVIPINSNRLLMEYTANDFKHVPVELPDHSSHPASSYLSSTNVYGGYDLYFLQSSERDAHRYSEMLTLDIIKGLESRYGTERSFDTFRNSIQVNGYEAVLEHAKQIFGTDQVERDINNVLINHYYGTDLPVSSETVQNAVFQDMISSYQEQHPCIVQSNTAADHVPGVTGDSPANISGTGVYSPGEQTGASFENDAAASSDLPAGSIDHSEYAEDIQSQPGMDGGFVEIDSDMDLDDDNGIE